MANKFAARSNESELLDDLSVSREVLYKNLDELETLNRLSRGPSIILAGLKSILPKKELITIVDLGCGSGDTLRFIARWGRKNKLKLKLIGVDINPMVIDCLNERSHEYPEISGCSADASEYAANMQDVDVVISSLFFHHLNNHELIQIFTNLHKRCNFGLVFIDLKRSRTAYYSSWIATRLFNGSHLSKNDGPLSVLKAFKKSDLEFILERAGIKNYMLRRVWMFRYQLIASF
ncbi:MAG TPA: SAM-dependent methyltransferase [Bacteroidales bacterium]|jgi:SAM-dependent methyltransferase|nr:SAM-dependent methyltransferase [Bacteroidales bacterium]